jgi:uncharacterized membrane protein YedE/YeeE
MNRLAIALLAGALFGAGLAWSGMVDPVRVRNFLDVLGPWDPTLGFVMAGAIVPMGLAWLGRRWLETPFAADKFELPDTARLDAKLALGAIVFGMGWAIGGLCPGPAIAGLVLAPLQAGAFVTAMFAGMFLQRLMDG